MNFRSASNIFSDLHHWRLALNFRNQNIGPYGILVVVRSVISLFS